MQQTDSREPLRHQFLATTDWADADVSALSGDASFRRYFRLTAAGGRQALLMDAPPDKEDLPAYLQVDRYLLALGLSAPEVYAADETNGFAIIEDFGEQTYTRLIQQGADVKALYELAVDVLLELQQRADVGQIHRPPYDNDFMLQEVSLLVDWYLPALRGKAVDESVRKDYLAAWLAVFEQLPVYQPTLVLRDYHVDNLMILADRSGVQRCGLLDFQDAMIGHPAYDLVSLLEDARRDVSETLGSDMLSRYHQSPMAAQNGFDDWYQVLAAQRHAKVAGIFVRLCKRDGKAVYLPHIPRVMSLLQSHLDHPSLSPVKDWFQAHLPEPLQSLPPITPADVSQPG